MSKINDLEQEVKADVKEATEAVSAENADKPWFKRLSLTTWIFIALALGVVAGLALQGTPDIATTYIKPLGTIFLNLIKMIVVPLVIFSMIAGVISLSDIKKVGAIGGKTIAYYLCTTACATVIGLIIANVFNVGGGYTLTADELSYEAKAAPSFIETIVNIFPSNAIKPLVDATMLQVIVISLFLGFGILLAGEKGLVAAQVVDSFNEVFMKIMDLIIKLSPIGVACLICPVVAENGPMILRDLVAVLALAYVGYILHALIVYSSTVKLLGGLSPLAFFKGMAPAMMMAFSSASSVGALPFNLECTERLGARREVASFVLPLGATINMDGTAIYQGVCAVFIATAYGVSLSLGDMVTIVLTATLASIGTAGVPGAGMVMLAMVLQSVGLPIEGIALVAGIDRVFDMGRTTVNITGDAACTLIVSRMEDRKEARTRAVRG